MLVWPRLPGAPNVKTRLRCVISLYMGGLKVEYPFMSCGQHTALFRNVQTDHLSTLSSPWGMCMMSYWHIVGSIPDSGNLYESIGRFRRTQGHTPPQHFPKTIFILLLYLIFYGV